MWIIRPPIHAHRAKVFYNTCVCVHSYACIFTRTRTCLCIAHTETFFAPLKEINAVRCTDVLFLQEKQTRIPFLMRTGAKVFYNVGEDTRAHIRSAIKQILTYRAIPFVRIEPVALATRCRSPTLTVSFCKSFADPCIYLPYWIHVNFLYENYAKLCFYTETRAAMTVIPRAASFPRGRDIFYARAPHREYFISQSKIAFRF